MLDNRIEYYRSVAARLRERADETPFPDIRAGYLELAHRFERLANSAERGRSQGAAYPQAASGGGDD